jgi:hypothetical protein
VERACPTKAETTLMPQFAYEWTEPSAGGGVAWGLAFDATTLAWKREKASVCWRSLKRGTMPCQMLMFCSFRKRQQQRALCEAERVSPWLLMLPEDGLVDRESLGAPKCSRLLQFASSSNPLSRAASAQGPKQS